MSKSAQVPFAEKAAKLKAENEAKRTQQPYWLQQKQQLPAKPEVEAPLTPERERAADRSQGPPEVSDDLLWGTQAIADFIGKSLTETQYLIRINALPIGRLGPKTLFASKKQLRRHLTPQQAAE